MAEAPTQTSHGDEFMSELLMAQERIPAGTIYDHYKHRGERRYKIIAVGVQEATEKVCVVYQSLYDEEIVWVRDLEVFESTVECDGQTVPRFQKVE